jgi:ABC-2 type transport system ATP-binding protein
MSEMENTADQLIVIGRGKLIAAQSVTEFAARGTRRSVTVRSPEPAVLTSALTAAGGTVRPAGGGALIVTGLDAPRVGEIALEHRLVLHGLTARTASLEEAFMELTADSVEYPTGDVR